MALDRDGRLLRAWRAADGRWRLPVRIAEVDPGFLRQLIAYEDQRFNAHAGVDLRAMARAAWQALTNGRVVSGASTLSMQAARLLERGPTGQWAGKLRQIRVALALERRLGKTGVLELYLTLAPYGGNLEGVRAAALAWFDKPPARLTPAEAALLVALPQSPEARRPDRNPKAALAARDRVLALGALNGALDRRDAAAAMRAPLPRARRPFAALAPHLTDRLRAARPEAATLRLTLDRDMQARMEALLAETGAALAPGLSAALIVADHESGEILASVGSPGRYARGRRGFVDMTRALRSPGSALKPLIYGLAFEAGLAHPETLIEDRPMRFGSWSPENFDGGFRGTVSLRAALQASLNLPAVALLDAVGPARMMARLRRAGATPRLPEGAAPGLAIALGGLGISLTDLATLYAGIAHGGAAMPLTAERDAARPPQKRVLSPVAAWQVADILAGIAPPSGAAPGRIAWKTGTSYGYRDAWAAGFDGRYVIAAWIGRPDGGAAPGISGASAAAPLLFAAFARLERPPAPLPPPPPDALTVSNAELPIPLRRFRGRGAALAQAGPRIAFPPDGARIDPGAGAALALKVAEGRPPFVWLIDGRPLGPPQWDRQAFWRPDGPGAASIAVIDALGGAAQARVSVE